MDFKSREVSRGTGPRATVKKRPPRYEKKRRPRTVGRGPVPRRASIGRETALVCVRFSRRSCDRGGNPLGCACGIRGPPRYGKKTAPFTVGRGPVPRRAWVYRSLAGDRPPRYGEKQVYRSLAGDRPPRYGMPGRFFAGDRPPRYGEAGVSLQSIKASYVNTLNSCWKG